MTKKLLILITILALLVRFISSGYPPLLWDEASLGYNAYSITKTGRDEYGQLLPLIFKSFGDYKPGVYVYLVAPFVAIFGLSPLTVRLPSIILGALTPLLAFLLVKKLSPRSGILALLMATLLAFNPYNIHFSRGSWETNILTFELLLGSLLFLSNRYIISALVFGLSLYTYQAGKMISLLLILALFIIHLRKNNLKNVFQGFILPLALLAIPIAWGLIFSQTGNRLQVISLLSYPRSEAETKIILSESNPLDYSLFHNRPIFFVRNFASRYLNHFSPRFLVFEGDWQNARHSAPYIGVLLYPSLVFLVLGLIFSTYSAKSPLALFFLLWLLIAPIPAALTRDSVQAVRSMSLSIPLMFFTAQGLCLTLNYFKGKPVKPLLSIGIFVVYFLSFIYWGDLYFNHMIKINPDQWLYGYEPAAKLLAKDQPLYQHIYFTDFYGQPYIYYLFFSRYNPSAYQQQANLISSGLDTGTVDRIDNIKFSSPSFASIKDQPSTMAFYSYDEVLRQGINNTSDFNLLKPLSPVGGHSTFYVYQNP